MGWAQTQTHSKIRIQELKTHANMNEWVFETLKKFQLGLRKCKTFMNLDLNPNRNIRNFMTAWTCKLIPKYVMWLEGFLSFSMSKHSHPFNKRETNTNIYFTNIIMSIALKNILFTYNEVMNYLKCVTSLSYLLFDVMIQESMLLYLIW